MELNKTNGLQTLTLCEIATVGGGPESSVGSGMNPPAVTAPATQAMRVLFTAEIEVVAGGPEGEVGAGVTPSWKGA